MDPSPAASFKLRDSYAWDIFPGMESMADQRIVTVVGDHEQRISVH